MATLASFALTTLDDVKELLGIDAGDTSKDNLIIRKINYATSIIESFCNLPYGHHFKEATYTNEEYSGNGSNQLRLKGWPVTSVTSFQRRNTTENEDSWSDNEAENYFLQESSGLLNLLYSQNYSWDTYRVTYVAGFATIPYDLAEACATLAAFMVENVSSGTGVKKKREGQREIEYFDSGSSGGGSNNLLDQLGLDEVLSRYVYYTVADR